MRWTEEVFKHLRLQPSEVPALVLACLISVGCLVRGAVDDGLLALFILASIPLLWFSMRHASTLDTRLVRVGLWWLLFFGTVALLQQLIGGKFSPLWQSVREITGSFPRNTSALDKTAWWHGVGRSLWLAGIYYCALTIGAHEARARLFFYALLLSGTFLVALTFFAATSEGIPASIYYSYSHGFVNANNAAAYFGVMLMIALAESARFFKLPAKLSHRRYLLELLDKINIGMIFRGALLAFSLILSFAGLLMTGSRAGILLTIFCSCVFVAIIFSKLNFKSRLRHQVITVCTGLLVLVMFWCFFNFGHIILSKFDWNGIDSNMRFDIYRAILPIIADHPWIGVGLGSFPAAFQLYRPDTLLPDGIIDKAHNSYLEFACEMGFPSLLVLLVTLGYIGVRLAVGIRERKERYITPALGFSVWLYAALFSLVDFPLQIPALCAMILAIVVICASQTDRRFSGPSTSESGKTNRVRIRKRRSPKL